MSPPEFTAPIGVPSEPLPAIWLFLNDSIAAPPDTPVPLPAMVELPRRSFAVPPPTVAPAPALLLISELSTVAVKGPFATEIPFELPPLMTLFLTPRLLAPATPEPSMKMPLVLLSIWVLLISTLTLALPVGLIRMPALFAVLPLSVM